MILSMPVDDKEFESAAFSNGELMGQIAGLQGQLSGSDFGVLMAICKRINPKKNYTAFPSHGDIALVSRQSVSSVKRSIQRLIGGGLLTKSMNGGLDRKSCTYKLTDELIELLHQFKARKQEIEETKSAGAYLKKINKEKS